MTSYHDFRPPTTLSGHVFPNNLNASGGGLTLTTPTLTPTTLKRIQDSFLDQEDDIFVTMANRASHPHQGGFVPPIVNIRNLTMSDVNNPTSVTDEESSQDSDISTSRSATTYNQALESNSNHSLSNDSVGNFGASSKKGAKGRSPKKSARSSKDTSKLSPDDQVRKQVRRERNKAAAARCRKRRMDHTNELTYETENLEREQSQLRNELFELQEMKKKMEADLDSHRNSGGCKLQKNNQPSSNRSNFTRRPNSLPLQVAPFGSNTTSLSSSGDSLIPIQTPSNGISLEGLMDGTAGLTPLLSTPSAGGFLPGVTCNGQQRTLPADVLPSSDSGSPTKLVSL